MRSDPTLILPNCKNIICIAISYYHQPALPDPSVGYVSMYALGRDYHKVLKNKLNMLGKALQAQLPNLKFRAITDSAPCYEQFLSSISRVGIQGRNNLVRFAGSGSFIFLGELLIDTDLITSEDNYWQLYPTVCAHQCPTHCHQCAIHCPTKALSAHGFDAQRCISYLTIEHHGAIDPTFYPLIGNRIYGCDNCQLHCPTNHASLLTYGDSEFANRYPPEFFKLDNLLQLTEEQFRQTFAGSPILRIGYESFLRNVLIACSNAPLGSINIAHITMHYGHNAMLDDLCTLVLAQHQPNS